jgi:hypothetical protein
MPNLKSTKDVALLKPMPLDAVPACLTFLPLWIEATQAASQHLPCTRAARQVPELLDLHHAT